MLLAKSKDSIFSICSLLGFANDILAVLPSNLKFIILLFLTKLTPILKTDEIINVVRIIAKTANIFLTLFSFKDLFVILFITSLLLFSNFTISHLA